MYHRENSQKNYKCIINSLRFLEKNILNGWTIYLVGLNKDIQFKDRSELNKNNELFGI